MKLSLDNKVAIVTGSAGGIGQAYAEAIAAAGASVVVADLNLEGAKAVALGITTAGGKAIALSVDVADSASTVAMVEAAEEAFGGVDLLVNNAAIFGNMELDLLISVPEDYLTRFLNVNMLGALHCSRAVYRSMRKRGGGSIVNQSSAAAYLYAGFYGLAKAGVNSITIQLAHELGGMNIRVNAIAPGPIGTEAAHGVVPQVFLDEIISKLALKREGKVEDLTGICLYLLSDQASWVTGQIFNVDGGQIIRP
ncbi:MAG: SDR family oxidoreductase [Actinobacteria bacterium]|nr:SDR family oxidoreductase [Actinomycetota bacterium]